MVWGFKSLRSQIAKSLCGNNSVVECNLAKVDVAGSNPVSRSLNKVQKKLSLCGSFFCTANVSRNNSEVLMETIQGQAITKRLDYKTPDFFVPHAKLSFTFGDAKTIVSAELTINRNGDHNRPLILNGCKLKLTAIEFNGSALAPDAYSVNDESLTIPDTPSVFSLKTVVEINPEENLALEGLYKSGDILCTQNEPEGFRRITFFTDRPDVTTSFTVELIGDKEKYPVLLSNGNLLLEEDLPHGMHRVVWEDPFPKPAYLFAVVAGRLGHVAGTYVTGSGRKIDCRVYCDIGNEGRCGYALASLMKAMAWDESRFGLEYDLNIYMIVAVDSFNMGAMENKGLNIFNSKYVLANEETATDDDFISIESVIGHEYFHNWTGNRVTLRDWFQLTLKEGLTVFRDQEFTSDLRSRAVKRINDVMVLRSVQFPEDAGPNSHPIRPETYMEINNFYTPTVYEKGAEVHRMIHTLLGEEKFMAGMKEYFKRHDGCAVTCEDFISAMEAASGADLSQFMLWYSRSGTPKVFANGEYDKAARKFTLRLKQSLAQGAQPLSIPLRLGLLNQDGAEIPIAGGGFEYIARLEEEEQVFVFDNIDDAPHVSLNRGFSAPVEIEYAQSIDELIFMLERDTDSFARWDAGQRAALMLEKQAVAGEQDAAAEKALAQALLSLAMNVEEDDSFKALTLVLPSEEVLAGEYSVIDFDAVHKARVGLKQRIASMLEEQFLSLHDELFAKDAPDAVGQRKLRIRLLDYLLATGKDEYFAKAKELYFAEKTMTGRIAALSLLANYANKAKEEPLADFYRKHNADLNLTCKWFAIQASSSVPNVIEDVFALEKNVSFDIKNPNLVRSVIGAFAANQYCFHNLSGCGYDYLADRIIEIDGFNPLIASGLAKGFRLYGRCDSQRKHLMELALRKIMSAAGLSKNTTEIVANTLNLDSAQN